MTGMAPLCDDGVLRLSRRRPAGDDTVTRERAEQDRARRAVARHVADAPDLSDADRPAVLAQTLRMLGLLAEEADR